jgi:esterase/lipase
MFACFMIEFEENCKTKPTVCGCRLICGFSLGGTFSLALLTRRNIVKRIIKVREKLCA